jgi:hypothetical protein
MTSMPSPTRRQQRAITIRSNHALARLAVLTRDGRSQVQVIEEALDRMPLPKPLSGKLERRARIEAILAKVPKREYPTLEEIDAELYDESGMPR